jgi:DNA-binding NtrC family response regulator
VNFFFEEGGSMGSTHSALELKEGILEFSSRKKKSAEIIQVESDLSFLDEEIRIKKETIKGIEADIIESIKGENELSKKHRLKRKLFWFFMEYFFESGNIPLKNFMGKIEKNIILRTLHKVNGEQKKAAEILGLKYTTLNEKIKKYRIRVQK